jgi:pyrroloquinoline-quinone synthase
VKPALEGPELIEWLRREGSARYHHQHPYHLRMHEGQLTKQQLQQWVVNRYYYQTRIPIKDALIVSKSEDPAFRRMWLHRIQDHDGTAAGEGGLELWLRLAEGVGLDREEVRSCRNVLSGVRFACDAYVNLVRERSLLEAVASSLTEFFAPDLMSDRIAAWERHYPWIDAEALAYFRGRVSAARRDSLEAIEFVVSQATSFELQQRCVDALIWKTEILWHLLDTTYAAYVEPGWRVGATRPVGIGPVSSGASSAFGTKAGAGSGAAP